MALRTNYLVLPLTLLLVYAIFPLNQHLGLFLIRVCLDEESAKEALGTAPCPSHGVQGVIFSPWKSSSVRGFQKLLLILKEKIHVPTQMWTCFSMFVVPPLPSQRSRSEDFKGHFLAEINIGSGGRREKHGLG